LAWRVEPGRSRGMVRQGKAGEAWRGLVGLGSAGQRQVEAGKAARRPVEARRVEAGQGAVSRGVAGEAWRRAACGKVWQAAARQARQGKARRG